MIQEFCCSRGTLSRAQVGACLTLRNQLSEETHMLTKHEALLGRGAWAESRRVGNPGGRLCHVACNLGFYGEGVARVRCSAKMDANKKDLWRWWDTGHMATRRLFSNFFQLVVAC